MGSPGQVPAAAPVQPDAHRLHPRHAWPSVSAATRSAPRPLEGLRLLDIGCGGGLLTEPMARLGAKVTGIDPTAKNIGIARLHAEQSGLAIDYRVETAEDLAAAGETFDVVLNMEVVEHVADLDAFIADCCRLLTGQGRDVRRHPQPDAKILRCSPSSAPNTSCAGCRAAPMTGANSCARRNWRRRRAGRTPKSAADRRQLRPAAGQLGPEPRSGRQLHGHRDPRRRLTRVRRDPDFPRSSPARRWSASRSAAPPHRRS